MSAELEATLRDEDAEARRRAQADFDRPLVVEAGAGTGKTTTLVARIVAWCTGPGWQRADESGRVDGIGLTADERDERVAALVLSGVAAITFTEAAAAEMADRVGKAFVDLAQGKHPRGLDREVLPSENVRERRVQALLGALDHLGARTIHAWCRNLLARHPIEAGVHPAFEVDAGEEIQAAVVREVLEESLRESLGQERVEGWLELAASGTGPEALESTLLDLIADGVEPAALVVDPWTPDRVAAAFDELEARLVELERAAAGLPTKGSGLHLRVLDATHHTLASLRREEIRDAAAAGRLAESVREQWEDTTLTTRLGAWHVDDFNKTERKHLEDLADALRAAAGPVRESITHWRRVDPATFDAARRVLLPLLTDTVARLRERGVLTFADLLSGARDLLRNNPAVLATTRRSLDLLLVDELQDTDPIQCDIVRMLGLAGPRDERPSLFLVGDPKQSIYGWRSADLRAYEGLVSEACAAGGERYRLSVNFRSAPPILAEVERLIAPVMRERPGVQPAFQPLLAAPDKQDEPGFHAKPFAPVEHWVSWGWEGAEPKPKIKVGEAARMDACALASELASLHADGHIAWGDVAVLFRTLGDLETYLEAMRDARVPYAVERDRSYFQRREVIEAAAAVRCVLDPNDVLALLTLLRSSVVGVPDAALLPLFARDLPRHMAALHAPDRAALDALRVLVDEAAAAVPADIPGIERVDGWRLNLLAAIESLAVLRREFESGSSDRFVETLRLLLMMDVTESGRYLGRYRVANLERFFGELTVSLSDGGDPHALLRHLRTGVAERRDAEEGRPQDEEVDAVRVMTIHKAKGLDFAHVYVPQLHTLKPPPETMRARMGWIDDALELRLLGAPSPAFHHVDGERGEVEAAERVRALYVAATRAEERLVLMGKWDKDSSPVEPEAARSMVSLMRSRRDSPDDLAELMGAQARSEAPALDVNGVRWRFPALAEERSLAAVAETITIADAAQLRRDSEALAERQQRARERMARPRSGRASAVDDRGPAHEGREARAAKAFESETSHGAESERVARVRETARTAAAAVGTAVHRILEEWDLAAPVDAELARNLGRLGAILRAEGGAVAADAEPRAAALVERFAGGPLLARLRAVREHIVARELPVLRPPGENSPAVAYESGIIDLVYRDPETDEMIVVDYKTDRLGDDAERRDRVAHYRTQGAFYTRALADALALEDEPRFELWFLDDDRIERPGDHAATTPAGASA